MASVVPSRVVPECIAQLAEHIAKHDVHGYSQPNRNGDGTLEGVSLKTSAGIYTVKIHGGDYDCSSMVTQILVALGILKSGTHMWTGNEGEILTEAGFRRIGYSSSKVQRGDVLWVSGHTGVALGNGKQADAHGDEYGGITGPNRGDQTGHEVEVRDLRSTWTYIYRYGSADEVARFIAATYKVTAAAETNVRSAPSMSASVTGTLDPGDVINCDGITPANGRIWATYVANSGKRRYISLGQVHSWVVVS